MARYVEAEHLLLPSQPLRGRPFLNVRQAGELALVASRGPPEERSLSQFLVPARALSAFDHAVQACQHLRPVAAQAVHRAGLDRALHHALVDLAPIDRLAEFEQGIEAAVPVLPHADDGLYGALANVLYRAEPEADLLVAGGREIPERGADVRRQDADSHVAALVEVQPHLVRVAQLCSEQGGHELHRVVRLEIGGDVGQEAVGGGVRLVEAVTGELLHQVEELRRHRLGKAALAGAAEELGAVLGHDLGFLLAHRPAEQVRFAQRIARHYVGDLHDLLLVDDDPVGLFQQRLDLGQEVAHGLAAVLAVDEVRNHAALDRSRAVQRVEGAQVLQPLRLVAAADVAHALGFELEHAACEALGEELVRRGVVQRDAVLGRALARALLDPAERIFDDRQRRQPQEVHLEQPHRLEAVHVVLGDDFVFVRLVDRNQRLERLRGDHDAGRMHGRVARHAFEALGCLDQLVDALVLGHGGAELGLLLDGLVQSDLEHVRHHLGEPVDLPEREVHHPAHVLDGRLGRHGVEGDDLRDLLATVLLGDVLDHLAAPVHAEIDVHVWHRLALAVQEALEEQAVLQGIDVGDRHRVGDQRTCRRPASGPDRDLPVAGDPDEIPDDQEVPGVLHLLDDLDLVVKPLRILLQRPAQQPLGMHSVQSRAAHLETLPGHVFEVGVNRVLGGHVELGERIRDRLEREIAHLGDFPRAVQGALVAIEQRRHLFAALEIELLGLEPHAVRVAERLPGLDA